MVTSKCRVNNKDLQLITFIQNEQISAIENSKHNKQLDDIIYLNWHNSFGLNIVVKSYTTL